MDEIKKTEDHIRLGEGHQGTTDTVASPSASAKKIQLKVYMTKEQKEEIEKAASACGMEASPFSAQILLQNIRKPEDVETATSMSAGKLAERHVLEALQCIKPSIQQQINSILSDIRAGILQEYASQKALVPSREPITSSKNLPPHRDADASRRAAILDRWFYFSLPGGALCLVMGALQLF